MNRSLPRLPDVKLVIVVTAGKGGVGKSTLAVNLAAGFLQDGKAVGILDLNLSAPSVPTMLAPPQVPARGSLEPVELRGLRVMSICQFHPGEAPESWQGEKARDAVRQLATKVPWGPLDLLFIDLPPGVGGICTTLLESIPVDGAVLVSTPQDVALQDAVKTLEVLRRQGVEILGIIENMSFHVCSSCGHRDNIFGHGGAADAASRLGVAFLGAVPIDSEVRKCSDSGMPVVLKRQESPAREALLHAVRSLASRLQGLELRKAGSSC